MRVLKLFAVYSLTIFMLFGCQNSSYKGSDINPEFPIPFEATLISKKTENQKVKTTAEFLQRF